MICEGRKNGKMKKANEKKEWITKRSCLSSVISHRGVVDEGKEGWALRNPPIIISVVTRYHKFAKMCKPQTRAMSSYLHTGSLKNREAHLSHLRLKHDRGDGTLPPAKGSCSPTESDTGLHTWYSTSEHLPPSFKTLSIIGLDINSSQQDLWWL